jgi:hypothetical protein
MSNQNRGYAVKPKRIKAKHAVVQAQEELVNNFLNFMVSLSLKERVKFAWSIVRKKNYHVKVEA